MAHCGEVNIANQQNKKWYFIYKEYVYCRKYLFVKVNKFLGGFNNFPYHVNLFLPSGIFL